MILDLIDEAVHAGARLKVACAELGLSARTVERWRAGKLDDERSKPRPPPSNKLSAEERKRIIELAVSKEYRDLSPNQIVPQLADEGRYLASESTFYRVLREEELQHHRERTRPPLRRKPDEHVADGPNQVWSWDITYLKSPVRGVFFYLYMIIDVWSRKIVGFEVHDVESAELASELFVTTCAAQQLDPAGLVLHADNGGPMRGSTMVVTLERLGVLPSFSRPRVSDDNPYSESLFRTLKYRPEYPEKPFESLEAARRWVDGFVRWYNEEHLHSGIRFVTPADRHAGRDIEKLQQRSQVYEAARAKNPERWSGRTRNWERPAEVRLNAPRRRGPSTDASAAVLCACEPERGTCHPKGRSAAEEAPSGALTGPQRRLPGVPQPLDVAPAA